MYEKEIEELQKIIDDSSRIVFFGGAEFPRKAESRISEARTGFTISSISIPLNRW